MLHNEKHIKSLESFVKQRNGTLPYDVMLNEWLRETGYCIHDMETVLFYTSLIPLIERRHG